MKTTFILVFLLFAFNVRGQEIKKNQHLKEGITNYCIGTAFGAGSIVLLKIHDDHGSRKGYAGEYGFFAGASAVATVIFYTNAIYDFNKHKPDIRGLQINPNITGMTIRYKF